MAAARTNLMLNPSFDPTLGSWSFGTSIASVTRSTVVSGNARPAVGSGYQVIKGAASVATSTAFAGQIPEGGVVPGQHVAFSLSARQAAGVTHMQMQVQWYDGSTVLSASTSAWRPLTALALTHADARHTFAAGPAPAGTTRARVAIWFATSAAGASPVAGFEVHTDAWIAAKGATSSEALAAVATYFDGDTPDTATRTYAWAGVAGASISSEYMVTLTATPVVASGAVRIVVEGGSPGRPLYVLRRDSSGTGIVRETSEGTVVWPALGTPLTLTDHEARQGESTQYMLTDGDGVPVASVRLELPLWGTWLKSPGRPYRNTRVYYVGDSGITRAARRIVVDIENASQRVVFARLRSTPQGSIVVLTQTKAQADRLQLLASDGLPLMLDTPTAWGVPFRYISVGDIGVERAYDFDGLRLEAEARRWTLNDVVQVAAPQGVPTLDPGRTYADLPVLYSAYVAMPATTDTYEQLATGMES